MEPSEFSEAMRRLGLTQAKLSRETDLHRVTLQRYANGKASIPMLLERYLKLRLALAAMQSESDKLEKMR